MVVEAGEVGYPPLVDEVEVLDLDVHLEVARPSRVEDVLDDQDIAALEAIPGVERVTSLTNVRLLRRRGEILQAGLDRYLTKPLRKQEIINQINAYWPQDAEHSGTGEPPGHGNPRNVTQLQTLRTAGQLIVEGLRQ